MTSHLLQKRYSLAANRYSWRQFGIPTLATFSALPGALEIDAGARIAEAVRTGVLSHKSREVLEAWVYSVISFTPGA